MRRFLSWSSMVIATAMVVFGATRPVAAQSDPADPAARAAFEAGRDAYDRGRFKEALQHYDRAYALSSNPKMLYNIGRAAEADLQHERAVQAYEAYLQALERAENREFVEARLAKLREISRAAAPGGSPSYVPYASRTAYARPARTGGMRPLLPGVRLYAGFRIGAGGTLTDEYDETDEDYAGSLDVDLKATPGLQVGAGYVWRYFGIGGELRLSSFKIDEGGSDRLQAFDIVAKPRGGYQFPNLSLEVYGALPFGISVLTGKDTEGVDPGFTVGFVAGATYLFTEHFGLNAELGWMLHAYGYDYEGETGTFGFKQFSPLIVNAMFAL